MRTSAARDSSRLRFEASGGKGRRRRRRRRRRDDHRGEKPRPGAALLCPRLQERNLSADYKPPNIPKQASTSSHAAPANNAPSPAAVAGTQQQQQIVHENAAESKCQNPEDISDRKDQNRRRGK